jgi:hypothetical protein
VRFTIAVHAGYGAPPDAIELLAKRLGSERDEARFTPTGDAIDATWGEEAPVSMASDERAQIGRRALLAILDEVCDDAPELAFEWFAISARGY